MSAQCAKEKVGTVARLFPRTLRGECSSPQSRIPPTSRRRRRRRPVRPLENKGANTIRLKDTELSQTPRHRSEAEAAGRPWLHRSQPSRCPQGGRQPVWAGPAATPDLGVGRPTAWTDQLDTAVAAFLSFCRL